MCTPAFVDDGCVMYANRYQQMKKLGKGSFGTAYLVHDTKSKHERKVLKAVFVGDVPQEESLDAQREAQLLSHLRHPNIVRFYDSFVDSSYFCIVTDYCELFIYIFPSSNIFLKRNQVKLGDFGISRLMINTLDKASTFIGTPFYMSPEVLRYEGYNAKSDIWSLGCVFYEMATCKKVFERRNILQTMQAILCDPIPSLPQRFSSNIQNLYTKMLSKEPSLRPTASELLSEFQKVYNTHNIFI
ncbi:unnamed protein product [Didymodactylos carnosus]|uniref:non-specific serine/threonine protein kinase n=1 Tax=Didymodactylos carnosus TaxID=1234261 RepID=A0A8S2UMY6_9BILA|nr:unnamed protein product [Didymodactylos carnosus]CAF4341645.1 unnamed protein product [Didymodactylos carnosus]